MHQLVRSVPNFLSTIRLLLACIFPFCREQEWIWIIIAAGASDFLDGWIARKWDFSSWQGGLLDAIADKLFVLSVLVTFSLAGKFSAWWIPGIIARDLTVTAIALYALSCRSWGAFKEMEAIYSGKLATAGQFLLFLTIMLLPGFIHYLLIITVLFSVIAAFDYGIQFAMALRKKASSATGNH